MPKAPKVKTYSSDEEESFTPYTTPTKKKASGSRKGKDKDKDTPSPGGKQKVKPWTPEEYWALFSELYKKDNSVRWDAVASAVGRDALSCRNKFYYHMTPKLEKIIKEGV